MKTEQDQANLEAILLSELHAYAERQLGQVPLPKPIALLRLNRVVTIEYLSRLRRPHTLGPSEWDAHDMRTGRMRTGWVVRRSHDISEIRFCRGLLHLFITDNPRFPVI